MTYSWTQSEPPRGSGWVRSLTMAVGSGFAPTRYREVVLTVSKLLYKVLLEENVIC